jgi:hypothetical protein
MATITVPKTPAKAFNPRRKPSDLIRQQIKHLEWALLPATERRPKRLKGGTVKTEAQAAAYIALLTARVREAYADVQTRAARGLPRDAGPAAPVRLPKVPVVTFSTPIRTKARKARKAAQARKIGKTTKKATRKTATAARRRR